MAHLVVSWDIAATSERWTKLDEYLRGSFSGKYSWVRPLSTFYVVKVAGTTDRDAIYNDLVARRGQIPEKVEFLVSPLMASGTYYDGLLSGKDPWKLINERTS